MGIRHILATPYHPQTNDKLERNSRDVKQVTHESPYDLEVALAHFVTCYDHSRYHIALSKVTPANVLNGSPVLQIFSSCH